VIAMPETSAGAAGSFADPSVSQFRAQLRDWLARVAPAYADKAQVGELAAVELRRAWEDEIVAGGWNCLSWPVEYGGRGLGPIEEFVFAEECARAGTPEGLGRVGRLLAAPAFLGHGTDEQKARFLPRILRQEDIWCQGFSEPNAGSDLAGVQTSARRDGDVYLVNGQKIWTSFGHYADRCLLIARTDPGSSRHQGLSMFAMPMDQPGVQPRQIRQISGASEFNEVFYDDARVPVDCRIGGEGEGWRVAMTILTAERGGGFAALSLNDLSEMLEMLDHCARGRPAAEAEAARLRDRVQVTRWHVMRAIEATAGDRDSIPLRGIMRLVTSELTQDTVRSGFELACPEHRDRWRYLELDARSDTIASGSAEIQRNVISERILGLPR
jgi:alkylation response protein AidB-like acyl-CoA dehydrogenase